MATSSGVGYQSITDFPIILDDNLEVILRSSALNLDQPSFSKSSDTSSSNSNAMFPSPAAPLDLTGDMHASPMSTAIMEDSMGSFDWSNWEDWMQWDNNNLAAKSPTLEMEKSPKSYENPSISSTSDHGGNLTGQSALDLQSYFAPGDMSAHPTTSFAFNEMPFEYGMSNPLTFDNTLHSPVDLTSLSTGEFPNSKSNPFPLEQFQFGTISDTSSSLTRQQAPCKDLFLESLNIYRNSLSPESDSRRSMSMSTPGSSLSDQSRKRKSSADDTDVNSAHMKSKRILGPKEAHKVVEKKYRMNINEKIAALRDSIPSFQPVHKASQGHLYDGDNEDLGGESRQAGKPNKGLILSKATEYIRHLERRNRKLNKEMAIMKLQLNAFKTLAMTRPMELSSITVQDPKSLQAMYANESRQPYQTDSQVVNQGHSPSRVARNIGRQNSTGSGGGYMSKMMVGSLAGLMILQGFSEKEQTDDTPSARGLSGLPTGYIGGIRHMVHSIHQSNTVGYIPPLGKPFFLFKAILLIGAIIYLISPSFFDVKPRENSNPKSNLELTSAPPLASPVEVRRSAWLTAVQTVWVPRQSLLLQIAALVLKSLKLFLRNTIGWHRYAILTGATEDHEAARVKAWQIALDAQLAGGDAEISMSRLILTMIASGTLPETPYQLMLQALHIHLLLWEAAQSRWGGWYIYRSFAAKFARFQWEKARKLHRQIKSLPPSNEATGFDALPDYLAHLLELDSDAIMVDVVVQRAYNLAWNKPTADKIPNYVDAMDSIIDDPAIRSPLDALAAWYSSLVLHDVLTISLEARPDNANPNPAIQDGLEVALNIAPTGSLAQSRGLVARAMLLQESRGANIAAALQALPTLTTQSLNGTSASPGPASPDVTPPDTALAIRCAMAIALLKRPQCSKATVAFSGQIRFSHDDIGLLGFTAMYHFLATAFRDEGVANEMRDLLENIAGALKIWIGRKESENGGLDKEAMSNVATLCVKVFNWLVGMVGAGAGGQDYRMAID